MEKAQALSEIKPDKSGHRKNIKLSQASMEKIIARYGRKVPRYLERFV